MRRRSTPCLNDSDRRGIYCPDYVTPSRAKDSLTHCRCILFTLNNPNAALAERRGCFYPAHGTCQLNSPGNAAPPSEGYQGTPSGDICHLHIAMRTEPGCTHGISLEAQHVVVK
eukprot:3414892-Amphidinium_carterae.1